MGFLFWLSLLRWLKLHQIATRPLECTGVVISSYPHSPKSILFNVNRQMKSFGWESFINDKMYILHVVNPCNKTMNKTQHLIDLLACIRKCWVHLYYSMSYHANLLCIESCTAKLVAFAFGSLLKFFVSMNASSKGSIMSSFQTRRKWGKWSLDVYIHK